MRLALPSLALAARPSPMMIWPPSLKVKLARAIWSWVMPVRVRVLVPPFTVKPKVTFAPLVMVKLLAVMLSALPSNAKMSATFQLVAPGLSGVAVRAVVALSLLKKPVPVSEYLKVAMVLLQMC